MLMYQVLLCEATSRNSFLESFDTKVFRVESISVSNSLLSDLIVSKLKDAESRFDIVVVNASNLDLSVIFSDIRLMDRAVVCVEVTLKDSREDAASNESKRGSVQHASGADLVVKLPTKILELTSKLQRAVERKIPWRIVRRLQLQNPDNDIVAAIVGKFHNSDQLAKDIRKAAKSHLPLLFRGESGTGKTMLASIVHDLSPRRKRSFVPTTLVAQGTDLQRSQLFGHTSDAFTGAAETKKGDFLKANGGTLFIDEIGDASPEIQVNLLRALQENKIRPVGAEEETDVDVRIVTATWKELVAAKDFRRDLYYRLNGLTLHLPALRERSDKLDMAKASLIEYSPYDNPRHFSASALRAIDEYPWPGNNRELQQVIHSAIVLADGIQIELKDLRLGRQAPIMDHNDAIALKGPDGVLRKFGEIDHQYMKWIHVHTGGNISEAVRLSGRHKDTVEKRFEKLASGNEDYDE